MKKLTLFIMLLVLCLQVRAQKPGAAILKGKITDDNKDPLAAATIFLNQNNVRKYAKLSDFNGAYIFDSVAPGAYNMIVKYVGYPDEVINSIVLKAGSVENVNVSMKINDSTSNVNAVIIT